MSEAPQEERWNKAQRLAIAGVIAPVLRERAAASRKRKVRLYDPETGEVTGTTTLAEVQEALFAARQIELMVTGGKIPDIVLCERCGRDVPVDKNRNEKNLPKTCALCTKRCSCCGKNRSIDLFKVKVNGECQATCVRCKKPGLRSNSEALKARWANPKDRSKLVDAFSRAQRERQSRNRAKP